MTTQTQESIYKAIDILVNNHIDKLSLDRTVTGVIDKVISVQTGEYRVGYQGGYWSAFAEDNRTYKTGQAVYVLVPESNFSNKKIILGESTKTSTEDSLTYISEMLDDYDEIGKNVISDKTKQEEGYGLHSYLAKDYILLYDRKKPNNSFLSINNDEFINYLLESEAIILKGSFRTKLPREHRIAVQGSYGLQFILAFNDQENPGEFKYVSYDLNSQQMSGNPYLFENIWSLQYNAFPIDIENFRHIESIIFHSEGFVQEDDLLANEEWGADIWVRDIELYGLRPVATYGDLKLKISTPYGATFGLLQTRETLEANAIVRYKTTIITNDCSFSWFVEDGRIKSGDDNYSAYAGAGWRKLNYEGANFVSKASDNRAYENKYLCVAKYEDAIIKSRFTFYNEVAKREIKIHSDLGINFSFDRGAPTLTCAIDGKIQNFTQGETSNRPDSYYRFLWQKISKYGEIELLDITYKELEAQYNELIANNSIANAAEASFLQSRMLLLEGVEFPKGVFGNKIIYPVKQIEDVLNIKCSVYLKDTAAGEEYFIGSDQITLTNKGSADPNAYSIFIVNGNQVFQYNESGISPADEMFVDPLQIKPLSVRFFDPAGIEVNPETYNVRWTVPLENTLIITPTIMATNPANDLPEWHEQPDFNLQIAKNYDYSALNNQLTCTVLYNNEEYSEKTTFLFTKIGDNGTNGTDITAKIVPAFGDTIYKTEPLVLEYVRGSTYKWNNDKTLVNKALTLELYDRNEPVSNIPSQVTWSVAGSNSKYMNISNGTVTYSYTGINNTITAKYRNFIAKAQVNVGVSNGNTTKETTYYAFYPIPVIEYKSSTLGYKIHIDKNLLLKEILYNKDGYNPVYNQNQGLKLSLLRTIGTPIVNKTIILESIGGYNENTAGGAFKLTTERNEKNKFGSNNANTRITVTTDDLGSIMVYVQPNDFYSGAFTNNMIHGYVGSTTMPDAEFWIPIHCSLNTYGLMSLNQWDGNHIEINEDQDYILAPQIGAGIKDKDNTFTGIVMGEATTYQDNDKNKKVGILGFSQGRQSIFMDARTGNTYLGLPDINDNEESGGHIELIPGGTSSIARWKINKKELYNIVRKSTDSKDPELGSPYERGGTTFPNGARYSIPHDREGILLSADPPYISIKGRELTSKDINGDNTLVRPGESLEMQLNPNSLEIFTIFRHMLVNGSWTRQPLVGIDGYGRFYSNTLRTEVTGNSSETKETILAIGPTQAFGKTAAEQGSAGTSYYTGLSFELSTSKNSSRKLLKMFADTSTSSGWTSSTSPVYLSGATNSSTTEYERAMLFYGRHLAMFALPNTSTSTENLLRYSNVRFTLAQSAVSSTSNLVTSGPAVRKGVELGTYSTHIGSPNSSTAAAYLSLYPSNVTSSNTPSSSNHTGSELYSTTALNIQTKAAMTLSSTSYSVNATSTLSLKTTSGSITISTNNGSWTGSCTGTLDLYTSGGLGNISSSSTMTIKSTNSGITLTASNGRITGTATSGLSLTTTAGTTVLGGTSGTMTLNASSITCSNGNGRAAISAKEITLSDQSAYPSGVAAWINKHSSDYDSLSSTVTGTHRSKINELIKTVNTLGQTLDNFMDAYNRHDHNTAVQDYYYLDDGSIPATYDPKTGEFGYVRYSNSGFVNTTKTYSATSTEPRYGNQMREWTYNDISTI